MISLFTVDIVSDSEDIVRIVRKKITFKLVCSKYHIENVNSIYYIDHEGWLFKNRHNPSYVKPIPNLKIAYKLILNMKGGRKIIFKTIKRDHVQNNRNGGLHLRCINIATT
jgi:hypothetical protein